jgi:uncharacterized protein with GYD domain
MSVRAATCVLVHASTHNIRDIDHEPRHHTHTCEAGRVTAGARQTSDETGLDRVGHQREYRRNALRVLTYQATAKDPPAVRINRYPSRFSSDRNAASEATLHRYLVRAVLTADGLKNLQKQPPTALKAGVAKFLESVGGKLEFWYFDYGEATAYAVNYYPDEIAAATAQLSTNAAAPPSVAKNFRRSMWRAM